MEKGDRPACPFYGFAHWPGLLMDSEGNQCALKDGHAPCQMEMNGEVPNWKTCPENTGVVLLQFAEVEVAPRELREQSGQVPFHVWFALTVGDTLRNQGN
jgi:hypothetical protein